MRTFTHKHADYWYLPKLSLKWQLTGQKRSKYKAKFISNWKWIRNIGKHVSDELEKAKSNNNTIWSGILDSLRFLITKQSFFSSFFLFSARYTKTHLTIVGWTTGKSFWGWRKEGLFLHLFLISIGTLPHRCDQRCPASPLTWTLFSFQPLGDSRPPSFWTFPTWRWVNMGHLPSS